MKFMIEQMEELRYITLLILLLRKTEKKVCLFQQSFVPVSNI